MKAGPLLLFRASALGLFFPSTAGAQGISVPPKDQAVPAAKTEPEEISLPKEALVRMEVFTLPMDEGRAATRKFTKHADLYAWLGAELEREKPKVTLERLMVLRVRAGQKSKLEEIAEYPSPTHFDPARIPQTVTMGAPDSTKVPASPTAPAAPPAKSDSTSRAAPQIAPPGPAGSSPAGQVFSPGSCSRSLRPAKFPPRS